MQDPWREMALERQFRQLVEPPDPWNNYPATLEYLRQRTEEKAEELAPWARAALDHQVGQLTDALLAGEYAKALAMKVWDPDAEPEEYKKRWRTRKWSCWTGSSNTARY